MSGHKPWAEIKRRASVRDSRVDDVMLDDRADDEIVAEILAKHGGDEETARQIVKMGRRAAAPERIQLPID